MPGNDTSRESHSAHWFRAMLDATKKEAAQEADHFMQMSASEPQGMAKPYIQVSEVHSPGNLPHRSSDLCEPAHLEGAPETGSVMVYSSYGDPG